MQKEPTTMTNEHPETSPLNDAKMQRLNLFATITGMTAVSFFVLTLIVAVFFPPLPPASSTPTPTSTVTATLTPTLTPSPTPTPAPRIALISVEYLRPGAGCQVDVTVRVNGEMLRGVFHVWNASYNDPAGIVSEAQSLPSGSSSGHLLTLGGDQPSFYVHEIWFEYDGGVSNRLTGVICPELTPAP